MKNILMVYPEFPTTYWSMKYSLPFIRKKAATIPLGLLTVAALLPDDYSVKLIDMNVNELKKTDILEADLVFISAMIAQKSSFDSVVALCNQMNVPVVAGGPYPTSSFEKITGVNHFVLNEAEITLPPFIKDYEEGRAAGVYMNTEKPDIRKTPPPRFDLIDFSNYNNIALQYSRGCPFNCEFCDIIELFGRTPRFKDTDQFIHEMDLVYRHGFRGSLFVVDDNFIGNNKKVKDLLGAIIAWQRENNYPFSLFTEASINLAEDDELLSLMAEAGFDMVFVGIETPDKESLKNCGKNQNLKVDLMESVEKIQRAGIEVTGGFIVGFDDDTSDIYDRQIAFIQRAGISMAMVGILGALPNTQLYRRLMKEGRIKTDNPFSGNNTHNLQMSFTPVMSEKSIIEGYKKILSEIYSPGNYFDRCYTLLERLPADKSKAVRRVKAVQIRALFLSLIKQTFSSYSLSYLRFLLRVIVHQKKHFVLAIEHAIKGYHFFVITKNIIKADELSSVFENAKKTIKDSFESIISNSAVQVGGLIKEFRYLEKIKNKLERKYRRLNIDIQQNLHDEFQEFINTFNYYLSRMDKVMSFQ